MRVNKRDFELLELTKEIILKDIKNTFLNELHINGRVYDNKPLTKSVFSDMTTDEMIIFLIESYIEDSVNKLIYSND